MAYRKFRIVLSKGWTLLVCSLSVAVIALTGCRSKKVSKTSEPAPQESMPANEVVDEYISRRADNLAPTPVLPNDSQNVKDMIKESNSLKEEVSGRMRSVIYGPPEVMQRRAAENEAMRHKIDSLDTEIRKARNK
jgi:hypothetical protein